MGFFDRFKRKHEIAPSALPKAARGGMVQEKQEKSDNLTATREKPSKDAQKDAPKRVGVHTLQDDRGVLLKPVVTEKATRLAHMGQYVFVVASHASKGAIREAVLHRYGVKPVGVNVQRYEGTPVRFGRRFGVTKGVKKAIVTLPEGSRIDVMKLDDKQ